MSDYQEIIINCLRNRNNELFDKYCKQLLRNKDVKDKILLPLYDEEQPVESIIFEIIKKADENFFEKFQNIYYLQKAVQRGKNKELEKFLTEEEQLQRKEKRNEKRYLKIKSPKNSEFNPKTKPDLKYESKNVIKNIVSADSTLSNDSSTTQIEMIKSKEETPEQNTEYKEYDDLEERLESIKIFTPREKFIIGFICLSGNNFKDMQDIMNKICEFCKRNHREKILPKNRKEIEKLILTCQKRDPKYIGKKIESRINPSIYAELINYLIETVKDEKKVTDVKGKTKRRKLILDFNKIRDYVSILRNNNVSSKKEVLEKCNWKKENSYEKEIRRILDLFKPDGDIFIDFAKKEFKSNEFAKIYDIHTAPNIIVNFMILDVFNRLKRKNEYNIKIADLIKELFLKNKKFNENHIKTFRKYTLLPRIKEMEEYGFISIDNDRYALKAKFLNEEQRNSLKYVVPFFCGIYPFASIGHFLANRLNINDKFLIEPYNISNILDDCVTYNLLDAINNKKTVNIVFKDKTDIKNFKPVELFIEKDNKGLLKVKDDKNEYYLNKIGGFTKGNNQERSNEEKKYSIESPIFSEIYSFYYKVFEDAVKIYKKCLDEKYVYAQILDKYKNTYNSILEEQDLKELFIPSNTNILQILANIDNIENISIPLTTLELRWLKTIMQDPRFDLFVDENIKSDLEKLVNDVEIFDLSSYKIFDYETNKYTNIVNKNLINTINRINKKKFTEKLDKLNYYSLKNHCFK